MRASWFSPALLAAALSPCALVTTPALADGGVAVAVTLPDQSPVQRDFAAGMVSEAYDRFAMLAPRLSPEEVAACKTDEGCLLALAKRRTASHLLLVGVASLGPTEYVVSLRVLDTTSGAEVVNASDLAEPGGDPAGAGRRLASRAFENAAGLPPKAASTTSAADRRGDEPADDVTTAAKRWTGANPLSLVGWGVAGAGVLAAGSALIVGIPLFTDNDGDIQSYSMWTGAGVVGALALGFGLVATDAYLLNGE